MRIVSGFLVIICLAIASFGQPVLYEEYFSEGSLTLDWFSPWPEGVAFTPTPVENNPSGDNWVGSIGGEQAASALAGTIELSDYMVEANVYLSLIHI